MKITYNNQNNVFELSNSKISYFMRVFNDGYLAHLYFGKKLNSFNTDRAFYMTEREGAPQPEKYASARTFSTDILPQEYPTYGCGDYRVPALEAVLPNGTSTLDLRYKSHQIYEGKKELVSLPSSYAKEAKECMTLEITLQEVAHELEVTLFYTIFEDEALIVRHSEIKNISNQNLKLKRAASVCLDFMEADFDRVSLYGKHAHERYIERTPLNHGIEITSSARGATSHQHHNFLALASKNCTEHNGEVYGTTLIWSGNFEAATERTSYDDTRLIMGINSFDFLWNLEKGETFTTPEAVTVYSRAGFNGMSQTFHNFVQNHIVRGVWQKKARPILVNSWEASYLDFTEESIVNFAKDAVALGAELVVLDDGWFGHRNKDNCSLGDWIHIDKKKLPNGLDGLSKRIHDLGAMFGLWVEPEMISQDSELFKAHPDWALAVPNHARSQQREQYVLDLSRGDVRDYIVESICSVLSSAQIEYVKWDMNRNLTEVGSQAFGKEHQQEIATRYVLGVYDIMNRITKAFPNTLFESCAGGGRRFDMGILCYMPQTWTSDNTDEVCRQHIQYGTSLIFPPITMGSHVSAVPNHQVGRTTPMLSRFICAASGNFGYEMDLGKLNEEEQAEVKEHISLYKDLRDLVQFGTFSRLLSPFEGTKNQTAWQFISQDESKVALMYFKNLCDAQSSLTRIKLVNLDEKAMYKVVVHKIPHSDACNGAEYLSTYNLIGESFSGDELMQFGLTMDKVDSDFTGYLLVLEKE